MLKKLLQINLKPDLLPKVIASFYKPIHRINNSFLIGEENGNPLQYSCLENPMDRGAW